MASTELKSKPFPLHEEQTGETEHIDGHDLRVKKDEDLYDEDEEYSPAEAKKLIHRVDRRLIVTCGVMYCVSLMDRTNLSAAAIAGMLQELRLTGLRYNIITLVFFATYVAFQPPATVLCRKIGPRPFLAFITFAWGVVMVGMGFPKQWTVMIPLRLLLGVFEAGFFPGCVYLISTWYVRYELQKRYAVFYLIGCVASALSGILAYGLMQMQGVGGYLGWSWIFIWEGVLTCIIGVIGYFFLVDFPDKASKTAWKFLTENECQFIMRRVAKDRDDADVEPFTFKKWVAGGADLKIWGFALIYLCLTTIAYAIAYFLPIILREGMGYTIAASQCLVAPPYIFAGILMFAGAWFGDKYHLRGPVIVFNCVVCLIGLPIMGYHSNDGVRYFGVFLVTAGANANIPTALAYQANNIRGQWKRAFCSATLVGGGGVGGIVGSLIFRSEDAPLYRPGLWACMACNAVIILVVAVNTVYFKMANNKARQGKKVIEGLPGFEYTY